MTAPIYDYLNGLNKDNPYPFHMPGHKRRRLYDLPPFGFDITEIPSADNLHKPEGIIKQAQCLMAELTGAKESFFCVNGSSGAVMAAVMSLCGENDKVLIARNCHRSVYNSVLLSGALPVYVYPHIIEGSLQAGINPSDVEAALSLYPDVKAVVITSPTYEGFCSDIKAISSAAHKKNIPVIVDEAHGAHFGLSPYFPPSAISLGADIIIQSWHKTLPVLTQCSVIHIASDLVDRDKLFSFLSMLQTSSPSYLFMASVDKCRDILQTEGRELFSAYSQRLDALRHTLAANKCIALADSEVIGQGFISDFDKGKLIFKINCNINGNMLENMLIKDYNFQIEMSGLKHIILMTSIMDTAEGYSRLGAAIAELDNKLIYEKPPAAAEEKKHTAEAKAITTADITLRQAFYSQREKVCLKAAKGRICADFIIPYPPGIPVLAPGEIIGDEAVCAISRLKSAGTNILGLDGEAKLFVCSHNL